MSFRRRLTLPNSTILNLTKLKAFADDKLTFSQMTNYKLEDFADDNFKLDENGEKVSKRVENTLGKGEIARYKQFLLFPQCFQKTCTVALKKPGLVWERVKCC